MKDHTIHPIHTRGYTLPEALVTMGLTTILIAILLPALSAARDASRTTQCVGNLQQIGYGMSSYLAITGSFPASYGDAPIDTHWAGVLTQHMGGMAYGVAGGVPTGQNLPAFQCPDAKVENSGTSRRYEHYSAHRMLMPAFLTGTGWTDPSYRRIWVKRPSEVIMIADAPQSNTADASGSTGNAQPWFWNTDVTSEVYDRDDTDNHDPIDPDVWEQDVDTTDNLGTFRFRHAREMSGNFLFIDGHVDSINPGMIENRNIRVDR